jgi:replication-associated recombination protein RarA
MDKFVDYLSYTKELRPDIQALTFPTLEQFQPLILYGQPGVGKYTQMLHIVKQYSTSQLKHEKKLLINTASSFYIKISDIHYEVDMELLGCNSKLLWDDIYNHIVEIIQNKYTDKQGIIVCKNLHKINHELLEIFYSYMQGSIKYIFLTESISFLPDTFLSKCKVLSIPRPSMELYQSIGKTPSFNLKSHTEIDTNKPLFTKIRNTLHTSTMSELREDLYSILIFDLGVESFVYYLITTIPATSLQRASMVKESILFLQYFNNNYRPIYHLEKLMYAILYILKT